MASKQNRVAQLREAVEAAKANGWAILGSDTVRRMSEHETPQRMIDNGWYDSPAYPSLEFLSFVFTNKDRVPRVVYRTSPAPWVGSSDSYISFKRALELLAQPIADSQIHDR